MSLCAQANISGSMAPQRSQYKRIMHASLPGGQHVKTYGSGKDACMKSFASCEHIWNLGSKTLQLKEACMNPFLEATISRIMGPNIEIHYSTKHAKHTPGNERMGAQ